MRDGSTGVEDLGPTTHTTSQRAHYRAICPAFPSIPQPYLCQDNIPLTHRCTMARFRCGTHWLATHTALYRRAAERQRTHTKACQQCHDPTWTDPNPILLCDSCDTAWHCSCLQPSLPAAPGHWFCPTCASHGTPTCTAAL